MVFLLYKWLSGWIYLQIPLGLEGFGLLPPYSTTLSIMGSFMKGNALRFFLIPLFLYPLFASAQMEHGFKPGQISFDELVMKTYAKDSTANAVVLQEFGETWIDNGGDHNLRHYYHVKIKIFNSKGFDKANFTIPLYRNGSTRETVTQIEASTFNLENNKVTETKLDAKKIFTENKTKYLDLVKFTLPNIKEGSVVEVRYQFESPSRFNFKSWEFQSDIPKVLSEYWARIPANYLYNITLRGFHKLDKHDSELVKDCFTPGGGYKADCSLNKYTMQDVPAFVEEDYMTAKSNFISSINFELSEIHFFDGRKDKITKEWKDVDHELRTHTDFGVQLRRGKDVFEDHLKPVLANETDSLKKAQLVFNFIKSWYTWNEYSGKYSDLGIKKAFSNKTGNTADINLSLVAALSYAGFQADPVILSTRENGTPVDLYPVMSDYNYVIARVSIQGKAYLLDATDPFLAFGILPVRCLNGKGRVMSSRGPSYWMDIMPVAKARQVSFVSLALQADGTFKGSVSRNADGYEALQARKKITSYNNQDEYIESVDEKWSKIKILKYEIGNLQDLDKRLSQSYEVQIEGFDNLDKGKLFLNPFFIGEWSKNPFTSKQRLYPVDLGAPIEDHLTISLEYPSDFEVSNLPGSVAIGLPNGEGRYLFNVQNVGNKLILNSMLTLSKAIYTAEEYPYLKELFNKVVQSYQTNLVFNKKL